MVNAMVALRIRYWCARDAVSANIKIMEHY